MILKTHRKEARSMNAHTDASQLFAFAMAAESAIRHDLTRWGAKHARYRRIRVSLRALVRELSLELDPENDLGLRREA